MKSEELRAIQAPFKQRYQNDPESARQTLIAAGEVVLSTLSVKLDHSGPSWDQTGMHSLTGGDGQFACAAEMLLHAVAGCAGVTFAAVATAMDVPIESAKLTVEGDLDFRGTLGVNRSVPVGFTAVRIQFEIQSTVDDVKLTKLVELAERYCVVAQTLKSVSAHWKRG
ncbi:MAG TPA: OsmC family protein [Planctomicrobium sp.]|nr:OsmC family protein [Planctomicrobium sp.]